MKRSILIICTILISSSCFGKSKCITHRGDVENALENSMQAFISAYNRGADGTELDIRKTKDGHPLIMHDQTMEATAMSKEGRRCPLTTQIRKLKLKEIQENCLLKNGEEIPTLSTLFQYFQNKPFFLLLEFKDFPKTKTLSLIKKYYENNPEFIRVMSISMIDNIFRIRNLKMFSPFWRSIKFYPTTQKYRFATAFLFDGVDVSNIKSRHINRLHNHDKEVSVWSKNSPDDIRKFMDYGADFITTDKLSNCLSVSDSMF